jgi:hypothetical protein
MSSGISLAERLYSMQQQQTSSQPAVLDLLNTALRERHLKATGALDALTQQAEQVLALCEAHPDDEALHQLLQSVQAQLVARCREKQATALRLTQ